MFGIKFIKFDSMTYVIMFNDGKVAKEGRGLSFFYYAPKTSISAVPIGSSNLPFIFNETTKDYQTITIQGQVTYKIGDPKQLADVLDFTVNANGVYILIPIRFATFILNPSSPFLLLLYGQVATCPYKSNKNGRAIERLSFYCYDYKTFLDK